MKILLASHVFAPGIGGIETISLLLAQAFTQAGHIVKVVTQTPNSQADNFPFEVIRRPDYRQLLAAVRWCDVYFHNNISLQTVWPLLFARRPWVVAHHTWLTRTDGVVGWQERMKHFLLRYAACISVSQAIADHMAAPSVVIGNAYRDDLFCKIPESKRDMELVFLGRLVSDKGVAILLEALGKLKQRGVMPLLTIIGTGPEEAALRQMALERSIENQVNFVGVKTGDNLVQLLNQHQIIVIPSVWKEPFGIVALEGVACGCAVVGSEAGGLRDAIGPCGVTFPNGNAEALAEALQSLLAHPERLAEFRKAAAAHLAKFTMQSVAQAYLAVLENAAAPSKRAPRRETPSC